MAKNGDGQSMVKTVGSGARDESCSALAISRDFGALIELFDRHLQQLDPSDVVTRRYLEQAQAAAKRGMQLGQRLSEIEASRE